MAKKKKNPIDVSLVKKINVDFSKEKLVSFSQFQIYQQCPHKWYNQYVLKSFKNPPSINFVFGTAVHNLFQKYLNIGYNISFAEADRLNYEEILLNDMKEEYAKAYEKNDKIHFSTLEELNEYYQDGVEIFKWFKNKRRGYFSSKGYQLIGIELPLDHKIGENIIYQGYIDLIIYDEFYDKIVIYDLKTSTKGWNEYNKKDDTKISQLLLYKKFFSELYKWPIDKIDVEFLILKRKAEPNEFIEFPKRIQSFKPADGKIKLKQSENKFNEFIQNCFDDKGEYINKEHTKNISKLCEWCPLYSDENLCKRD